jgi:hypothetical protein
MVNTSHNNDTLVYWKGLTVSMMTNEQELRTKIAKMLEEQLWNNKSKATKNS